MPQKIDVPGMGVVEFPDGMDDAAISAAIMKNMPKQDDGTVGDWEVEGKDYFLSPLTGNISRPNNSSTKSFTDLASGMIKGVKDASISGMAKGLYETGKSVATLPGDVYAGKVDPFSNEGISRSMETASLLTPVSPATGVATKVISASGPTNQQLKEASTSVYKSPEVSQLELSPNAISSLAENIKTKLAKGSDEQSGGIFDINAPKTYSLLDRLSEKRNSPFTFGELHAYRKSLGGEGKTAGMQGLANPQEPVGALIAKQEIDKFLGELPDDVVLSGDKSIIGKIKEADKNYAAYSRGKSLEEDMRVASEKSNVSKREKADLLRNEVNKKLVYPKKGSGFNAVEKDQLRKVSGLTTGAKIADFIGERLSPSSLKGNLVNLGLSGAAGAVTANPVVAALLYSGLHGAGALTKQTVGKSVFKNFEKAKTMVNSRSPLAEQLMKNPKTRQSNAPNMAIIHALMGAR